MVFCFTGIRSTNAKLTLVHTSRSGTRGTRHTNGSTPQIFMRSNGNYERNDTELCHTSGAIQVTDQKSEMWVSEAVNGNHRSAIILFSRICCRRYSVWRISNDLKCVFFRIVTWRAKPRLNSHTYIWKFWDNLWVFPVFRKHFFSPDNLVRRTRNLITKITKNLNIDLANEFRW